MTPLTCECGLLLDPDGSCYRCKATGDPLADDKMPPPQTAGETSDVGSQPTGRTLRLTPASEIRPRPVRWAWDGRVPTGAVTLIPGREGIGKSLTLVWMTAQITRGKLPGLHYGTPRAVFYAATEDSWQRTIVPRLIAAGADLSRVYRVDVATEVGRIDALSLPRDCREVERAITDYDIALMCIDPLMSTIGTGIDTHRDRELRGALEPLVSLADRTGCAVVGLAHFNKSSGTDPLNLVSGSRAFTAVIRAAIGIARDPDADDGSCVMTQIKNNLGKLDVPSLRYVVEGAAIPTDEGPADVGVLRFLGDSDRSVYDILRDHNDRDDTDRSERDDAAEWLRPWLIDQGGEAARRDVFKSGRAEGFSEATLKRARPRAGVTTERRGFGGGSVWRVDLHRTWPPSGSHSDRLAQTTGAEPNEPNESRMRGLVT